MRTRPERRAVISIASGAAYYAAGVTSTPAVQASVHVADFSVTDAAIAYRTGDGVTVARNWSSLAP